MVYGMPKIKFMKKPETQTTGEQILFPHVMERRMIPILSKATDMIFVTKMVTIPTQYVETNVVTRVDTQLGACYVTSDGTTLCVTNVSTIIDTEYNTVVSYIESQVIDTITANQVFFTKKPFEAEKNMYERIREIRV